MLNRAMERPITEMRETLRILYLYYDLDETAKENAFSRYDNDSDATFYLDGVYDELFNSSIPWFENQVGNVFEYDGRTDTFHPKSNVSIYSGSGFPIDWSITVANWCICYDADMMDAWNKHVSRMAYLYQRVNALWENEYVPFDEQVTFAHGLNWYEEKYQEELENAIQDVCTTLNKLTDAEIRWTFTREFYETEFLDCDDSEHWFTSDGTREYIRDSTISTGDMENVYERSNYVEIIYENRNPYRLFIREYSDD